MVGITEAKKIWSSLLSKAEDGEEVVITRRGRPIGKLVPIREFSTIVPTRNSEGGAGAPSDRPRSR